MKNPKTIKPESDAEGSPNVGFNDADDCADTTVSTGINGKSKALWLTQTAALLSLLIVLQFSTGLLGNVFVTGSAVNLILIISVMLCGLTSGLTVALISPFLAKLIGIGPLWSLIPFIALGNVVLILFWHFLGNRTALKKYASHILALAASSTAKFLTLYLGIVRLAIHFLLKLPDQQAKIISSMFSVTQLITAIIGGVLAIVILPPLKKALNKSG